MGKTLSIIESLTRSIGSVGSIIAHTFFFFIAFLIGALGVIDWDTVLLVLTTAVSLEAIYLAIFIQITVNQNTESLREVEVDVDEIQKDIDAIEQDVDEIQIDEKEEEVRDARQQEAIDDIGERLQRLVEDVSKLSKRVQ
ncbi:DUF1003 domain-containing protein [Patescibacteria group bacterium]|nr:DUF1003 domain-containing protein [Patescibacteria group bacterium]